MPFVCFISAFSELLHRISCAVYYFTEDLSEEK